MEQILCYWPDPASPGLTATRRAMLPLKIRVKLVSPDQTNQSLGYLLGREGFEASHGEVPVISDPILVMDNLSGPQINALLLLLSKGKVPRSVFKAVITSDNVSWTLAQLWEELKKERSALEGGKAPEHR